MRLRVSTFALVALAIMAGAYETVLARDGLSEREKEKLIRAIDTRLQRSAFSLKTDFTLWRAYAAEQNDAIQSANTHEELTLALQTALGRFETSHLAIFSPEGAKLQRAGQRFGIGISIRPVEHGLFVTYVLPQSPADKAGIRSLDTLTHVDDAVVKNVEQLAGQPGQSRSLAWVTKEGLQREATIKYDMFPLAERTSWRWINDRVGLLRVQSFQHRYYRASEVKRAMRQLRDADAIIVDLRGNRGGLSLNSRHLAARFAPRRSTFALLAKARHQRSAAKAAVERDEALTGLAHHARPIRPLGWNKPYDGKVAVLVDSLSASGADIFPAFVQESGRGIVIGESTAGALQMARTFRLPFGYRLYAPIAEILTPQGKRLEGAGLAPDIALGFQETADDARIIEIALDALFPRKAPAPLEAAKP